MFCPDSFDSQYVNHDVEQLSRWQAKRKDVVLHGISGNQALCGYQPCQETRCQGDWKCVQKHRALMHFELWTLWIKILSNHASIAWYCSIAYIYRIISHELIMQMHSTYKIHCNTWHVLESEKHIYIYILLIRSRDLVFCMTRGNNAHRSSQMW